MDSASQEMDRLGKHIDLPNQRTADTRRLPRCHGLCRTACLLVLCILGRDAFAEAPQQPSPLTPQISKQLSEPSIDTSTPLYEQPPFDLLYLNAANNNAVLKLSPVPLPDRKVPQPLPRSGYLEIELFDRPGERYRVPWQAVVQLKLFEQLLLEQAMKLIQEKRFDEAYDYLDYVATHYPNVSGLAEVEQLFLIEEARAALVQGQSERAFADLCRLSELNPNHPELSSLIGQAVDTLVAQRWQKGEYAAARGVVETLSKLLPEHPAIEKWRQQWQTEAAELEKQVRQVLAEGNARQADRLVRKLRQVWPQQPRLDQLIAEVRQAYPRFQVGITQPGARPDPTSLIDWGSRRCGQLIRKALVEYTGPGPEGGEYRSAFLRWQLDAEKQTLTLRLRPERPRFADGRSYTAYDLAQQLASRADRHHEAYFPPWAEVVAGIRVFSPEEVIVNLRFVPLKPEALLQCVPVPAVILASSAGNRSPDVGPFVLAAEESSSSRWVFLRNSHAGTSSDQTSPVGPAEIEEIAFPRCRDALRALRGGEVDIVDRVNPWELPLLAEARDVTVQTYRVPLVHLLVPNLSKPLPGNRDFRRAMLYAIDRDRILQSLLGGKRQPGCQVISGPFPAGTSFGDPLGYAYDAQIKPREYQPSLALALSEIAFRQAQEVARKRGLPPPESREVVLAHPPHEIAREACRQIQEQWRLIGWTVKLVEASPDRPPPPDYDFLYVEAAIWEPEVDVIRLITRLIPERQYLSPQVELALAGLGHSADWPTLGQRLRDLHRWVYDDLTVLPLWQLVDFYAYRSGIKGLDEPRVSLYQNVETWQFAPN